jgi:hypothetical protein
MIRAGRPGCNILLIRTNPAYRNRLHLAVANRAG